MRPCPVPSSEHGRRHFRQLLAPPKSLNYNFISCAGYDREGEGKGCQVHNPLDLPRSGTRSAEGGKPVITAAGARCWAQLGFNTVVSSRLEMVSSLTAENLLIPAPFTCHFACKHLRMIEKRPRRASDKGETEPEPSWCLIAAPQTGLFGQPLKPVLQIT